VIAALGGLAQHWAQDSKAKSAIGLALKSGDPDLRAAVTISEKKR
jgi:hypothetical protein